MIYVYLSILILPFTFVLIERRLNTHRAVLYTGVYGGMIWMLLSLMISDDWTLICEPLLLICMSLGSLSIKDEKLFKYQPCVAQSLISVLLLFNGVLFNLGQRYVPIIQDGFARLAEFEPYLWFNCRLSQMIFALQGRSLELEFCLEKNSELLGELSEALPWENLLNDSINATVWPLLFHSIILGYIVYQEYDSILWLAARLAIYPMVMLVNFYVIGTYLMGMISSAS